MENQSCAAASETLGVGVGLAFVGGFLEAYTYILRGGVFANAQTGNMALLAINAAQGEMILAAYYMIPIFAFFLGVCVTEFIKQRVTQAQWKSWEHIVVCLEAAALAVIAFLPLETPDAVVNVAVSMICAMQTNTFRKTRGMPYATTMCTGNLRSASAHLFVSLKLRDARAFRNSLRYLFIIASFCAGCFAGTLLVRMWAQYSALVCSLILAVVCIALKRYEKSCGKSVPAS